MKKEELDEILRKHKLWLDKREGGERARLNGADLSQACLRQACLREADLSGACLCGARLNRTDLRQACLREADLSGADLDYSSLPLWCGSLSAHFDDRQLRQIAYHLVKAGLQSKNSSEETKEELKKIIGLANKFHKAIECGIISEGENEAAGNKSYNI